MRQLNGVYTQHINRWGYGENGIFLILVVFVLNSEEHLNILTFLEKTKYFHSLVGWNILQSIF
jgi:hypothetical protein